jgi:hypothetical protein
LKAATTAAGSTSPSNLTSHTTGVTITGALSSRKRRFFSFRADMPTSTLGDKAYVTNGIKSCKTYQRQDYYQLYCVLNTKERMIISCNILGTKERKTISCNVLDTKVRMTISCNVLDIMERMTISCNVLDIRERM